MLVRFGGVERERCGRRRHLWPPMSLDELSEGSDKYQVIYENWNTV